MVLSIRAWAFAVSAMLVLYGCGTLKEPVIVKNASMSDYKYVYITPTKELTSGTGGAYMGQNGIMYGSTQSKSINPSDVISGVLIKNGYVIIPELRPELNDRTLIVNYGESGRRKKGWGYTIEVTIQFISAESYETVSSCTAEGQGSTEADDIRIAINRALSALLK